MSNKLVTTFTLGLIPLLHTTVHAYDVNDKLSLGGVLAMTLDTITWRQQEVSRSEWNATLKSGRCGAAI